MKAIQLQEFGGADAFEYVDLDDPTPGEGEVLVEVARSGVDFADTHATHNDYLAEQQLPLVPGAEIAGRTAAGDRVVALVDDEQAAGALQVTIGGVYPLSEAGRAHEALESRATTGKLLLNPSS